MLSKIIGQSVWGLLVTLIISTEIFATEPITISSTKDHTTFLEVYTSQGCSSCPPAERWLSTFTDNKTLWSGLIPLNFHVDYWDYLGWKDPFALAEFSQRQRIYAALNKSKYVATPGFMVNGKGWQDWFNQRALPLNSAKHSGVLIATIKNKKINVNFNDSTKRDDDLVAHVALLGFGIETEVKSGENKGQLLKHDFVVIGYQQSNMEVNKTLALAKLTLPTPYGVATTKQAIVFWVSQKNDPTPLQVAANWLYTRSI